MTKRMISVRVGDPVMTRDRWSPDEFPRITNEVSIYIETSLTDLIPELQRLQSHYGKTYQNLKLEMVQDCDCYDACSCNPRIYLIGTRLESDLEYNYRIKKEADLASERERRERDEYEILKKKYGGE